MGVCEHFRSHCYFKALLAKANQRVEASMGMGGTVGVPMWAGAMASLPQAGSGQSLGGWGCGSAWASLGSPDAERESGEMWGRDGGAMPGPGVPLFPGRPLA